MSIEKKPFKNTVIYIRTSTKEQNPMNQLKDCESIRPKIQKTDTFVDYYLIEDKQSAWSDVKRDGFDKLKKAVKEKRVVNIIVWDLDRIYRNRKKLIDFFKFCKAYKCSIYSYNQKWLDDINNIPEPWNEIIYDLMLQVMGWLAQDESDKKSKRIKLAVRKKDNKTVSYKGKDWGRKPISAYKFNKIKELSKSDLSIRDIAREVNLAPSTVHKTLRQLSIGKAS